MRSNPIIAEMKIGLNPLMFRWSGKLPGLRRGFEMRILGAFCILVAFPVVLPESDLNAGTERLVILHTNDIHDHVRASPAGGGLPYVSSYVKQVREKEPAVLLLDAGDVGEKGDYVGMKTRGAITWEAMGQIGYDGVVVGNHDFDPLSIEELRLRERLLGEPILCLNILGRDGNPLFKASRIFEVGELKVGVIGMIVPRKPELGGLNLLESGNALQREAKRLRPLVSLVVALCHDSVEVCAEWSRMAPEVSVFISGHSHDVLRKPYVVQETGGLIVQAGYNVEWVGRLELEIDRESGEIMTYDGRVVPMEPGIVQPDEAMVDWVRKRESALAPEATEWVFDNPSPIGKLGVAQLAAESLRVAAGADIGFCHPDAVIRSDLPTGSVDFNTLFLTGGFYGHTTVVAELSGIEIEAYIHALSAWEREQPVVSGFRVIRETTHRGAVIRHTDLDPSKTYRVAMPEVEWERRILRMIGKAIAAFPDNPLAAREFNASVVEPTFTRSMISYIRQVIKEGDTVADKIEQLAAGSGLGVSPGVR